MGPETRYTKSGDTHIAYQVTGEGPLNIIFVPGFVSNIEASWSSPSRARFYRRLASFSRLVLFDKRGTGLSDRSSQVFTLEQRMVDMRAVMDAVEFDRAVLFGISEGGPMSILFAATHPDRTEALVMYGSYARRSWADDHPYGWREAEWDAMFDRIDNHWGTPDGLDMNVWAPSIVGDEHAAMEMAAYMRSAASPGAVRAVMQMNREIDVRDVLPAVRVPTLVVHRTGDRNIHVEQARDMARRLPNARLVELPGEDHVPWIGDGDAILDEVQEFLTGVRQGASDPNRVFATVLFTDIVASTETASRLGDRAWREILEQHHALGRREIVRFGGREIVSTGDGFLAAFDGPVRAIECACSMVRAVQQLDISIRAGLHTGEIELVGEDIAGITVHVGARIAALAGSDEIVVSGAVRDLVAGSDIRFVSRGLHELKGVEGAWELSAVKREE